MFIFNIKNITYVSLFCDRNTNDVISTEKKMPCGISIRDGASVFTHFSPVEMASFVFLSQHRDTKTMFDLFYKITSVLRQKCGFVCVICVSVL